MPVRIQRRRTPGWRMPVGAVCVTRPGKWGNPFAVGQICEFGDVSDVEAAVRFFSEYAASQLIIAPDWLAPLRGKDLACWCPLDRPCHADVLLELANVKD